MASLQKRCTKSVENNVISSEGVPTSGAMLFDRAGNIESMTEPARRILSQSEALELRGTRLHALDSETDRQLQRVLDECTTAPGGFDEARTIALCGRSMRLTLNFAPLTEQFDSVGQHAPQTLGLIRASVDSGFTAAERAVADLLRSGLSLRKIAERRGTSFETVRTQAKAIYGKLGVHSRTQMMAALAGRDIRGSDSREA